MVRGGRADQRFARRAWRRRRTPATPTTSRRARAHRAIGANEMVLLDLWGKLPTPGAVFADITWVGLHGVAGAREIRPGVCRRPGRPRRGGRAGARRGRARRTRVARLRSGSATRDVIDARVTARSSSTAPATASGEEVHGNGVHMDDYETHDERRLIPGTGFTIEPGIYTPEFGVRTEINMFVGEGERGGHRAAADRDRDALGVERCWTQTGDTMTERHGNIHRRSINVHAQDHAFLRRPHRDRVARRRDGHRLASRSDAGFVGQMVAMPAMNSAPLERTDRRHDVPQHRQGADARRSSTSGPKSRQRTQDLTEFFGGQGGDELLRRFFGGQARRCASAAPAATAAAPQRRGAS